MNALSVYVEGLGVWSSTLADIDALLARRAGAPPATPVDRPPATRLSAGERRRASASVWRMAASTIARAAADFGDSWPSAAVTSARMASADLRWNCAFLGRSSASATGIACFLQLVDQLERLARGEIVGAHLVEHGIEGINFRLFWRRRRREKRQIV